MKVKVSFDVMTNNGSTHYGSIMKELDLPVEFIDEKPTSVLDYKQLVKLTLQKFPTLKHSNYKIKFNYVHYTAN